MSLRPSTAAAIQDMPPPGGYKKVNNVIPFSLVREKMIECFYEAIFDTWTSTLADLF